MRELLLAGLATANPPTPRIIGGDVAPPNSEPHIVSLQKAHNHFCGGSILSNTWILTAAHCHQINYDHVEVVAGAHNIHDKDEANQRVPLLKLIRHADYDFNGLFNDVAVAKTGKFLLLGDTVKPIKLPSQQSPNWLDQHNGEPVRVCGWGKVQLRPQVYPDLLHCVDVDIIDSVTCNSSKHYNGAIADGMFCAGMIDVGGKDACQGDSGGPIRALDGTLIGLVSWGYSCASANYPGVYTDVAVYKTWITNTMDEYQF